MNDSEPTSIVNTDPFPLLRATGILVGVSLAVWIVVVVVLWIGGWGDQVSPVSATAGVCLVGSLITVGIFHWAALHAPQSLAAVALGGTVIRLGVALAGGLILVNVVGLALTPIALWMLGWYLLLLLVDVAMVVGYVRGLSVNAPPTGEAE